MEKFTRYILFFIGLFALNIGLAQKTGYKLRAIDLSEDFGPLSSKNDEILILIYEATSAPYLNPPILAQKIVFGSTHSSMSGFFEHGKDSLIVYLIELDFDNSIEQIDPVIRIHHELLPQLFRNQDYNELERYFSGKDLLGLKEILLKKETEGNQVVFKGRHKMDAYHYELTLF